MLAELQYLPQPLPVDAAFGPTISSTTPEDPLEQFDAQAYRTSVEGFIKQGSTLVAADIGSRYRQAVPDTGRPLEPGFIPPDVPARITIVTYYPSANDLTAYSRYGELRENFAAWANDSSLPTYRRVYEDWIDSLPHVEFYRDQIAPVLDAIGVSAREMAWLPLVKAPHSYDSPPVRGILPIDRPELRIQLRALRPAIVWVQMQTVYNEIEGLVKSTSRHHTVQKMPRRNPNVSAEREEVIADLGKFLAIEEQRISLV